MLLSRILSVLNEYNTSNTLTKLAASGGKKATGKNYDNIIAGKSNPYKTTDYTTKYERVYPQLAKIVKKIKDDAFSGDVLISGAAFKELQALLKTFNPKEKDGEYIMPFGDNIRLKKRGNNLFFGKPSSQPNKVEDITNTNPEKEPVKTPTV